MITLLSIFSIGKEEYLHIKKDGVRMAITMKELKENREVRNMISFNDMLLNLFNA